MSVVDVGAAATVPAAAIKVVPAVNVVKVPARGVLVPIITLLIWFPPPETVPLRVEAAIVLLDNVSVPAKVASVPLTRGSVIVVVAP